MIEKILESLSLELSARAIYNFIVPLLIMLGGFFLGGLIQVVVVNYLTKAYKRANLKLAVIVNEALKGLLRWMGLFIGVLIVANYLKVDDDWQSYVRNTAMIGMVLVGTAWLARVAISYLKKESEKSEILQNLTLIHTTLRIVIFSVGGLIALQTVGISIAPILTALGVGGLAVALALQPTLSNLFSGLSVTLTGKFKNGDFVELSTGEAGFIEDISWRNTTLRTVFSNHIIVPNNKFADEIVKSYNWPDDYFSIFVDCGVAYESNLQQVEEIALQAANKTVKALKVVYDNEPMLRYKEFGDSSINFSVNFRTNDITHRIALPHAYIMQLKADFDAAGINIPFPIRTLYFADNLDVNNHNDGYTAEELQQRIEKAGPQRDIPSD